MYSIPKDLRHTFDYSVLDMHRGANSYPPHHWDVDCRIIQHGMNEDELPIAFDIVQPKGDGLKENNLLSIQYDIHLTKI